MTEHSVYVVLLAPEARCDGDGTRGDLYVGETARTPEERFDAHKLGGRTSVRVVKEHGIRLAPEHYEHLPAYRSRCEAEAAEKRLRADLIAKGYRVCGGKAGITEAWFVQAWWKEIQDRLPEDIEGVISALENRVPSAAGSRAWTLIAEHHWHVSELLDVVSDILRMRRMGDDERLELIKGLEAAIRRAEERHEQKRRQEIRDQWHPEDRDR